MAQHEFWGEWAGSGRRRARLRHLWHWADPAPGASQVQLNCQIWLHVDYGVSDSSNTFSYSGIFGSHSGSASISLGSGGSRLLASLSQVVDLGTSGRPVAVSSALSGIEYIGTTVPLSSTVQLPGSAQSVPAASASVATTRVGTAGTGFQVDWSAIAGASDYVLGVWRGSTGGDAAFAYPAGTTYVDDMPPDDAFRYWVAGRNAVGVGNRTYGPTVYTRPNPPAMSWSRSGSQVLVAVSSRSRYAVGHRVQWRTIGTSSWLALGAITGPSGTLSHTPPAGATVEYRAESYVSAPSETASVWALLGPVVTLTPPLAPTLLAPLGIAPSGTTVRMEWRHEPVDGSTQSAAEVRYRPAGAQAWTTVTATTLTYIARSLAIGMYEWQVRTRGAHANYGPWCEVQGFRVAPRPVVTITSPGATFASNRVTPTLSISDASGAGVTGWELVLLSADGAELSRVTGSGPYVTATIPYTLANSTSYVLRAKASSATGLESLVTSRNFTTSFALPGVPTVLAVWDETTGRTRVTGTRAPSGAASTATIRLEVLRDGVWVSLGEGPGVSVSAEDLLPPLASEVTYRAVAISALPSEAVSAPITIGTPTGHIWLTTPDGKLAAWLSSDVDISESRPNHVVLAHYVGDAHPTAHYGPQRPRRITLDGDITPHDGSPVENWWPLMHRPVWLRTPVGHRLYGTLTGDLVVSHTPQSPHIAVRLSFEETREA